MNDTVLIAGGSGLIGMRLSELLVEKGYRVVHLSRSKKTKGPYDTYLWDPEKGYMDEEALEKATVVINLAGAGIADKPWTEARKQLIINSRVDTASLLLESFRKTGHWPKAYLSGAAIGYYGHRGDEWLYETSTPGTGFLAESCIAWEDAIDQIGQSGLRTVAFRIGLVLSTSGGALEKILLPFHFFTGAYFGDGNQWYSWIHIDDLCEMFIMAIEKESMKGIYNAVAPHPVTNKEFVRTIKEVRNKPAFMASVPVLALRAAMGEMADVVLNSNRVSSEKIAQAGYPFLYPQLKAALQQLLND
ncbi:MAG TPA: TIGR01777 family oxidoreductase [Saprospiraceae bacterium]|nr:TIGR01777 family oxidoreductase [Saprospiraceae bacterium]HMQ82843.1 TIGR01777 family oxidoreductase [Saprospiraceae bacterium]